VKYGQEFDKEIEIHGSNVIVFGLHIILYELVDAISKEMHSHFEQVLELIDCD
jgi:hypothetical protein